MFFYMMFRLDQLSVVLQVHSLDLTMVRRSSLEVIPRVQSCLRINIFL